MRVLLLSAYDAQSHRHWHQMLSAGIPDWDWTVITLPPRHFAWRVRGNPLAWSVEQREVLEAGYDLVLATSMVDLATLRGLVPALSRVPSALYFHENQFVYPQRRGGHGLLEAHMVSLYSALAADRLLFNSAWNRDTFLEGVAALLKKLPDGIPRGVPAALAAKSTVLPVPVALPAEKAGADAGRSPPLRVLWNHRWEYDKGPGLLLDIAEAASQSGVVFNVVGQQFRQRPDVFDRLEARLRERGALGAWGFIEDRQAYRELLATCDIALSTADHDFQGLAVMEACLLGCTPLVPDRLAYPEWFPETFRYRDAQEAVAMLASYAANKRAGVCLPRADLSAVTAEALLPRYREVLGSLAGGPAGPWVS